MQSAREQSVRRAVLTGRISVPGGCCVDPPAHDERARFRAGQVQLLNQGRYSAEEILMSNRNQLQENAILVQQTNGVRYTQEFI
eukprot:917547-Rhodomonas_salina.4